MWQYTVQFWRWQPSAITKEYSKITIPDTKNLRLELGRGSIFIFREKKQSLQNRMAEANKKLDMQSETDFHTRNSATYGIATFTRD